MKWGSEPRVFQGKTMLAILRRLIEVAQVRQIGLDLLAAGLEAAAAVLNSLGLDKTDLARVIRAVQLADELRQVPGSLADAGAFELRLDLACELARVLASISDTHADDAIVAAMTSVASDPRVRKAVLFLLERAAGDPEAVRLGLGELREELSISPAALVQIAELIFALIRLVRQRPDESD